MAPVVDLRDSVCSECGARCMSGQTHLEHNLGWKKKLLLMDWNEATLSGFPGWELQGRFPTFVKLVGVGGGHPSPHRRSGLPADEIEEHLRDWDTKDGFEFVAE